MKDGDSCWGGLGLGFAGEAVDEFGWGDGGGADLADDDAGGVVGKDGGLDWSCAGGDGEGEGGDDGVTGATDVEDFAGDGGDVERGIVATTQEHAEFAEGDEQQGRGEGIDEVFGDAEELGILEGIGMARAIGQPGEFKSFLAVGCDE